jgi:glucose/arabinose dehydrogenase
VPFNACRYVDGSVIVVGVEVREDGAIIFAPKQAQALWRLRDAA